MVIRAILGFIVGSLFGPIVMAQSVCLPRTFDFWLADGGILARTGWISSKKTREALGSADTRKTYELELLRELKTSPETIDPARRVKCLFLLGLIAGLSEDSVTAEAYVREMAVAYAHPESPNVPQYNAEETVAEYVVGASLLLDAGNVKLAETICRTGESDLLKAPEMPKLLLSCDAYVAAGIIFSGKPMRAIEGAKQSFDFFEDFRYDFPAEFVFSASQYISLCEHLGKIDESDRAFEFIEDFADSRKEKTGLAYSHLCFARALRYCRSENWDAALQAAREGLDCATTIVGRESRSARQFDALFKRITTMRDDSSSEELTDDSRPR